MIEFPRQLVFASATRGTRKVLRWLLFSNAGTGRPVVKYHSEVVNVGLVVREGASQAPAFYSDLGAHRKSESDERGWNPCFTRSGQRKAVHLRLAKDLRT